MIRFVVGPDRDRGARFDRNAARTGNLVERAGDVVETARAQGGLGRAFARAARGPSQCPRSPCRA